MDSLRLTLLVIGIAFIAILYVVMRIQSGKPFRWPRLSWPAGRHLFSRDSRKQGEPPEADAIAGGRDVYFREPDEEDIQVLSRMSLYLGKAEPDIPELTGLSAVTDDESHDGEPLIIVLNVMAKSGHWFSGPDVLEALHDNGMQHGEMMIFHRYPDNTAKQQPVFSLANTVEPGNFNLDTIDQLQTPGLSLFMQLPGPLAARDAFELMLRIGRNLTEQLGGNLCDERRSVLTLQTIGHIKEQIESFLFRQKMARLQKHRPDKVRK